MWCGGPRPTAYGCVYPSWFRFSKFALAVNLFQFVSMAGSEKIQWPQILLDIYESMSFWNLNMYAPAA